MSKELEFLERAIQLSNGLLYSSYHLPQFTCINAKRNTLDRLNKLGINDVSNKTILDLGSHVGGISLELARRGAKVEGYEYNQQRVNLCNEISSYFSLPATFYQMDFNKNFPKGKYDVVLSLAVDFYIKKPLIFYKQIISAFKKNAYLEINANYKKEFIGRFLELHEIAVIYLGDSYSPIEKWPIIRKKDLFKLKKCFQKLFI